MAAKSLNRIAASWKRLTGRECADNRAFEAEVKRNWKRWLAAYVVFAVTGTVMLMYFAEKIGWARSFVIVNFLCAGILGVVTSAWYGYRKYTGPGGRKHYAIFLGTMFAGGLVGAIVASIDLGRPITAMGAQKIGMIFAVVAVLGAALVVVIATIAYARTRQVAQRMALLQAEADRERLTRQGVQAQLKLLQAQVEPHFLFNTLANLRFLVQTDATRAVTMLDHLIHYLRTALPEIRAESSTVGREIELAHAYLEILRIRMGGALDISTEAPREVASLAFPPMVVLTLVENAIKHGIAPVGKGRVRVSAAAVGDRLRLTVEDDGRGLVEPIGQGMGLANVRDRLRALFGDAGRLELAARPEGGAIATIEMPL